MNQEKLYELIEKLFDFDVRQVFKVLYEEGKELSEELIAEKTGLRLNSVRRALNLLLEKKFVTYRRARDPDKQRNIFFWKVDVIGLHSTFVSRKRMVLERLKYKLEQESATTYYVCPLDNTRYTLEEALEHDFTCPRCGSPLVIDEKRDERLNMLK
ncbi:MAG TPA: transcription factor, partial [Pyrodictium sp.]|nr:transcription factor [Pyrodictium sp.]